jgi:hypothetical protein
MSDALLVQGLWAAAEAFDEDEDGPAENADLLLEELAPLEVRGGREGESVFFGGGNGECGVVLLLLEKLAPPEVGEGECAGMWGQCVCGM